MKELEEQVSNWSKPCQWTCSFFSDIIASGFLPCQAGVAYSRVGWDKTNVDGHQVRYRHTGPSQPPQKV